MIYKKRTKKREDFYRIVEKYMNLFHFLKQNKVKKVATGQQQQQQQQTIMAGWLTDRANKTSRRNFKRVL